MFVSFEGIDGSGKTTQVTLLKEYFENQGKRVVLSREPGGSPLGEEIRKMILTQEMSDRTEALLFAAQRAEAVAHTIVPALIEKNTVVISDRFVHSSIAYQGVGLGLGMESVRELSAFACNMMRPDITLWLCVDTATAHQRIPDSKRDRIEARGLYFQEQVHKAYAFMASNPGYGNFVKIDANQGIGQIHADIIKAIESLEKEIKE